ncbi:MAG: ABC transporter substrate-binding protein [Caldilineaceae bacterium]
MKKIVKRGQVSRREFMRLSALAGAGAFVAACGGAGPAAPAEAPAAEAPAAAAPAADAPAAAPGQYNEAPMLADLVSAGSLPPVDERLPSNPMVMPVAEMTGSYGGTFRRGFKGVSDRWGPTKLQDRGMAWYDQDLNMQARIAESWEINEDASAWTFHMREGMKWSDGSPFTTEAIQWWYDNELKNETITPAPSSSWTTGADATLMELEVADDYTFTLKFADPNPLFIFKLGRLTNALYAPGHYMAQFHMDLTADQAALEAATKEAGFESWDQYYADRNYWYLNPEKPSVGPWISKNELSNELFLMERNPYFFAVDADGNQLPYVDNVEHRLFETNDVFNLWIINGEIDFQNRHVGLDSFTLFKENEENGDYQVMIGSSAGHVAIQLNLTTKNEPLREFFNNRDVRIALSLAVDRVAMNELIFDGLLTPRQYSPLSKSPQFYEKLSNAHIEYDVDQANALLDGAGYERGADGTRVYPGTSDPISFVIEGTDQPGSQGEQAVLQVIKYYEDVGVKASYKGFERSLYEEHWGANEIEAAWWGGDRTVLPIVAPWIFLGTMIDRPWADAWGKWRNSGDSDPNAEEPPADHWIRDIWAIWDKIEVEPDSDARNELFFQILDIWAEEIPMVGYLGESPALIIVKNGIHNYLPGFPIDDTTGDEHLLNTETYFWESA